MEEQRIALVAVVADAAAGVFCGGLHLAQASHLLDLALVGVAALATTGTVLTGEVVVSFTASEGTGGAESPTLRFVEVWIDLIHLHPAPLGIELAVWHQFSDGHVGGSLIAEGR